MNVPTNGNGQFLGHRRVLTIDEQREGLAAFMAKSLRPMTPELRAVCCATWYTAIAFGKAASYEGFDAALLALQGRPCEEVSPTD